MPKRPPPAVVPPLKRSLRRVRPLRFPSTGPYSRPCAGRGRASRIGSKSRAGLRAARNSSSPDVDVALFGRHSRPAVIAREGIAGKLRRRSVNCRPSLMVMVIRRRPPCGRGLSVNAGRRVLILGIEAAVERRSLRRAPVEPLAVATSPCPEADGGVRMSFLG